MWTLESLKQYFDALRKADKDAIDAALSASEKAIQAALAAQEKAVLKAEVAAEERFKLLNELRGDVATKTETQALEKVVDGLKERLDRMEGKGMGLNSFWVYVAAGIPLAILLYNFINR